MGIAIIVVAGVVGAMLMMVILAVMANILYAFGIGVPLVSAKVKVDPITGDRQDLYVTRGTEGHGTPTVAVISSLFGGLFGGAGGALDLPCTAGRPAVDRYRSVRRSRHLLRELRAGLVQHHRYDRRLPRPQVQEVAKGVHRLSGCIVRARLMGCRNRCPAGGGILNDRS